jgi:tetratricopeptide (TPR) repeat protein
MSDIQGWAESTIEFTPDAGARAVRGRYEAAWQEALDGGSPPNLETFLSLIIAATEAGLRQELESVDRAYQRRLAERGPGAAAPDESAGQGDASSAAPTKIISAGAVPDLRWQGPAAGPPAAAPAPAGDAPPAPEGYEILEVLGRGGMGVVYKARQVGLDRLVALKMVLTGAHAGLVELTRFRAEAQAVGRLSHPNIVQVYEVGEYGGLPYFSLEFLDGGSLEKLLAGRPLPAREAAALAQTLARAVQYAHAHGVVHRDLKPGNVLLAEDGTPKVSDFGLAKRIDEGSSSQTRAGTIMGTPSYMAPEQARGEAHLIGPAADVYALGAILYELLTGRPPFRGVAVLDTLEQVRSAEPVPPRRLQPKVPRDLETVCLKCLRKEPEKRYASAGELADDLGRFLGGAPVRARPVGRAERLWRRCRQNPRTAALVAAVVVLLAGLGALAATETVRRGRERGALAEARQAASHRLRQAADAVAGGEARRALDLLEVPDALVEHSPALADVRADRDTLRARVRRYAEFKLQVDRARYAGLFGARAATGPARGPGLEDARQQCLQALRLAEEVGPGSAPGALPALDPAQDQLLREDAFDASLLAAQVEWDQAAKAGDEAARREAARRAVAWLDRTEAFLPPTRALYARRADYRAALGDAEGARADRQRAEAVAPGSAVDHFWQGVAARLRGEEARGRGDDREAQLQFRQALASYVALLRLRPDHFWGYYDWAVCHVRLGNPQDALVGFTACTHIKPDAPWPYYNRGTVHLQLQQYDPARQDFDRALERDPGYAGAYLNRGLCQSQQGRHADAVADFGRAIEARPDDYALAHFHRAQSLRTLQRYREARDDYSAALRLQPDRSDWLLARGLTNLNLKDFDAALADCGEAARRRPADPVPRYLVGVIHLGRRQFDRAVPALERAMAAKPDYPKPYLARAQVRLRQGRLADALTDVNLALDRLPPTKKAEALNDRADVYRATSRLDEAAADYRQSVALEPKQPDAYIGLALVAERRGRPDEARDWYERMVAADPGSAAAHLRRAEFRRGRGEFAEALADCDRAAELDKDSALPGLVRAGVEAARGADGPAVAEAERLLSRAPAGDGHALYAAACVYGLAAQAAAGRPDGREPAQWYADRAIGLLAEALERGFHDLLYEEQNRMADDPALAALRPDPRFQELVGPPAPPR